MKRFFALLLVLLLALGTLSACKPNKKDDDILPPSNGDDGPSDDGLQPGSDPSAPDNDWDLL